MVLLSRLFDWRNAIVVVSPATLLRWKRELDGSRRILHVNVTDHPTALWTAQQLLPGDAR